MTDEMRFKLECELKYVWDEVRELHTILLEKREAVNAKPMSESRRLASVRRYLDEYLGVLAYYRGMLETLELLGVEFEGEYNRDMFVREFVRLK